MVLFQRVPARLALTCQVSLSTLAKFDKSNRCAIPTLIQNRIKRGTSSAIDNIRKAVISRSITSNNRAKKSSPKSEQQKVEGIFGLRPIDYSIVPPIPTSPPPPPAKPGLQKYLFPFTLAFTTATVSYFYMNNKNDNYEYWRAMQSGEALQIDDDEDDDYEEEEEE